MKFMFKLFLLTVILICATPFIMKDEYGRPLMTLDKLTMPATLLSDFKKFLGFTKQITSAMDSDDDKSKNNITEVYKWKDKEGAWHFSDSNTPDNTRELVKIDSNANIVHIDIAKEIVEAKIDTATTAATEKEQEASILPSELMLLEQAPDLINKAKNIDQIVGDRYETQQKAMKEMGLSN